MDTAIEFARVADIYDEFVQTTLDVPFFLSETREASGEVLELMCGTGRLSIPLLEAGVPLVCVDYSPESGATSKRWRERLALKWRRCTGITSGLPSKRTGAPS